LDFQTLARLSRLSSFPLSFVLSPLSPIFNTPTPSILSLLPLLRLSCFLSFRSLSLCISLSPAPCPCFSALASSASCRLAFLRLSCFSSSPSPVRHALAAPLPLLPQPPGCLVCSCLSRFSSSPPSPVRITCLVRPSAFSSARHSCQSADSGSSRPSCPGPSWACFLFIEFHRLYPGHHVRLTLIAQLLWPHLNAFPGLLFSASWASPCRPLFPCSLPCPKPCTCPRAFIHGHPRPGLPGPRSCPLAFGLTSRGRASCAVLSASSGPAPSCRAGF
jgi:hypothetical protein